MESMLKKLFAILENNFINQTTLGSYKNCVGSMTWQISTESFPSIIADEIVNGVVQDIIDDCSEDNYLVEVERGKSEFNKPLIRIKVTESDMFMLKTRDLDQDDRWELTEV